MNQPEDKPKLRVIIGGGGIAGLTLANALQHTGVDYVLLEGRADIAPQLGASLGLAPNGSRILDQLGCFEDLEELAKPVESVGYVDGLGKELCPQSDGFQLHQNRTNYPVSFLDRTKVLEILARHIQDPSRLHLGKKITRVDQLPDEVVAHCADGSAYRGDILVGADGASSKVRSEMWRAAGEAIPQAAKEVMTAEYQCLFGISSNVPSLVDGHVRNSHKRDVNSMVVGGKGNRVFWFLFIRLPRIYKDDEIPRFTAADAETLASQHLSLPVLPGGAVTFGDLWKNRITATLQAMEEADYPVWTWGRFVCIGDSAHKMTPNLGAGGMMAIEGAAALANALHDLQATTNTHHPTLTDIQHALSQYQSTQRSRASKVVKDSYDFTRIQALKTLKDRLIVKWVLPYIGGDYLVDTFGANWIGAPLLTFLPPPHRALTAEMSLNLPPGLAPPSPKPLLYRTLAVFAFALLTLTFLPALNLIPFPQLETALTTNSLTLTSNLSIPIPPSFYHIPLLDTHTRPALVLFAPSSHNIDPPSHAQMLTFLTDIGLLYTILLIESTRRANALTPARFPALFGMLFSLGIGAVLPVYYALYVLFTPVGRFGPGAADRRLTDRGTVWAVGPAMVAGFYAPVLVGFLGEGVGARQVGIWVWHYSPVWVAGGMWVGKKVGEAFMTGREVVMRDRLWRTRADVMAIRVTVGVLAVFSAGVYLGWGLGLGVGMGSGGFPVREVFMPRWMIGTMAGELSFEEAVRTFLQWDQIYFAVASLLWVVYLFVELRMADMTDVSWVVVLGVLGGLSMVVGAGAATAVGWLWREEILVRGRRKKIPARIEIDGKNGKEGKRVGQVQVG